MMRSALLFAALPLLAQDGFVSLFDGKTLDGWKQCNGSATYRVADGAIVGRTAEGSPNSFLCSEKEYGDFVLEFEVKADPALNSGVQFRSHRYPAETTVMTFNGREAVERKHEAGRVNGYQVEVATEASGASGGVYDEARRGWLDNIAQNPVASKAFKDDQWNRYRVEANGDHIRTWVNGVPCADLVDSMDLTGFLALQVHAFKGEKPAEVRFRNIRIQHLGHHTWRSLWDGKTFAGWMKMGGANWTIEDGAIHAVSTDDPAISFLVHGGNYEDSTVRLQVKILKGNSGFFIRSDRVTHAGYEVEIDAEKRTGGLWEVGGRNWVTGPEDNAAVKAGDWNTMTASVHGDRIVFHLNGVKTVDLPNDTAGRKEGHVTLQCHGGKRPSEVWFRDIEILAKDGR